MRRREFARMLGLSIVAAMTGGCSLLSRRDDDLPTSSGSYVDTKTGWVKLPDGSMTDDIDAYNEALDTICRHHFGRDRVIPAMLGSVRFNFIEADFQCPHCKVGMIEDNLEDEFVPPEPGDRSGGRGWFQVFGSCNNVDCKKRSPIKGAIGPARPLAMVYEEEARGLVIPVPIIGGWVVPRFISAGIRLPEIPPLRLPVMEPVLVP